jgi:hypothetical protein
MYNAANCRQFDLLNQMPPSNNTAAFTTNFVMKRIPVIYIYILFAVAIFAAAAHLLLPQIAAYMSTDGYKPL